MPTTPSFRQESSHADRPIRSLWFGMRCHFTRAALEGAIAEPNAMVPTAIILPASPRPRTPGWPESPFDRWLRSLGIEIIELGRARHPEWQPILTRLPELRLAVGIGACFPYRVPRPIRDALPLGVINIHPSLLPALRGPDPVFHAVRLGLDTTGVTLHLMDEGWDTGPVLAQQPVAIPGDVDVDAFEASLARRGGAMLAETIIGWQSGVLAPHPQDEAMTTSVYPPRC